MRKQTEATEPTDNNNLTIRDAVFTQMGVSKQAISVSMLILFFNILMMLYASKILVLSFGVGCQVASIFASLKAQWLTSILMSKDYQEAYYSPKVKNLYNIQCITALAGLVIVVGSIIIGGAGAAHLGRLLER